MRGVYPYSADMRHTFASTLHAFPWRRQALCLLPAALMLVVLSLALGGGDAVTLYFMRARAGLPGLESAMEAVSDYGSALLCAAYAALLVMAVRRQDRRRVRDIAMLMATFLGVSILLVNAVKIGLGSPRPPQALAGAAFMPFSLNDDFQSFPSGHVAQFTTLATPLSFAGRNAAPALGLGLGIALLAFSRLFLSRHHIIDVAGGMVFASMAVLLMYHFCSRELP